MRSFAARPFAWSWMTARRPARSPVTSTDAVGLALVGAPRAGRSHARPHRSHHRRARGARPAPQRESRAADGARHPKKSRGLLREAPGVRFAWISAEKAEYTIAECCRALRVSASGFYAWQQRPESPHAVRDRQLRVLIRASHEGHRRAYGSPRVHRQQRQAVSDGHHGSAFPVHRRLGAECRE